jgi:hypothetical protein
MLVYKPSLVSVAKPAISRRIHRQLLPNVSLERDEKALIDLVNGLSSGSIVLVNVTNGDLANHVRVLEAKPPNVSQAMAIKPCLLEHLSTTKLVNNSFYVKIEYSLMIIIVPTHKCHS